eukprot:CAMPEP_0114673070 /NCGR_PEP_ID=MMETSP0191-20121206/44076_1 /TAXON_ID=126664 /ORGANISM="Sorites sp." /LENGTH=181 /DNA_ID=CAMNT_0001937117 /DNA_START=248 /DNA_END=790 /DNA_ORIENTATION=-
MNSHRLALYAKKYNKQNDTIEMMMNYYFENEKDISDIDILTEIGNKIGLPKVKEFLKSNDLEDQINHEINKARYMGVSGVPTFVINEDVVFSGGRQVEYFLQVFARLGLYSGDDSDDSSDDGNDNTPNNTETKNDSTNDTNNNDNNSIKSVLTCLDDDYNEIKINISSNDNEITNKIIKAN